MERIAAATLLLAWLFLAIACEAQIPPPAVEPTPAPSPTPSEQTYAVPLGLRTEDDGIVYYTRAEVDRYLKATCPQYDDDLELYTAFVIEGHTPGVRETMLELESLARAYGHPDDWGGWFAYQCTGFPVGSAWELDPE